MRQPKDLLFTELMPSLNMKSRRLFPFTSSSTAAAIAATVWSEETDNTENTRDQQHQIDQTINWK